MALTMTMAPGQVGLPPASNSDTPRPPAIRARGLGHVFPAGPHVKRVLCNVDLDVAGGEVVILMGPSGCGKTTLLTLVGALRAVQVGTAMTLGVELAGATEPVLVATRRRIGFIYQAHNLHESLTAIENIRMGLEVHGADGLADWRERCERLLRAIGMAEQADSYPAKLSGGQKQRVAIARALIARPALILADEPTSALDRQTGRQIVDLLLELARDQGSAILMVTHDPRILDIADRLVEMEDGRIVGSVRPGNGAGGVSTDAASVAPASP